MSDRRMALLLLAAVILLWGANWPVIKVGLQWIPPLWFAASRVVMGALTLFAVLAFRGELVVPTRQDLPVVLSVGLLHMAGFLICINVGLLFVGAGRAAILAYTTPLWVTPAAVLLLGERLTPLKIAGLLSGLCGVAVLFNPLGFDWSDRDVVIGNAILMTAALSWAGAILHIRAHDWRRTPLQLAPWQMLVAAPVLTGLALAFEEARTIDWNGELALVLLYNGVLATAFCYWAVVTVNRSLPAISTSLGLLGVPVASVVLSAPLLGEPLTAMLIAGLLLIVGGLALVNLADSRAA